MNELLNSFGQYYRDAEFGTLPFWAFPLGTVFLIWLLTNISLKFTTKKENLKTVFIIYRSWIIWSLIIAGVIISLICFMWTQNLFSKHPLQLSLLISLFIAMSIPVICIFKLRKYYTFDGIKEITGQPKTPTQLDKTITSIKKVFRKNKLYFLIPLLGFTLLLFSLNRGENLISIVFDNSGSMSNSNAVEALSETFDNLQGNNQITLTTLEGLTLIDSFIVGGKNSLNEIMSVNKSSELKAGNVISFNNSEDAKNALTQISDQCKGSPVCEGIWKTYLHLKETKPNQEYKNKLLIIISDGQDNPINESLAFGKFFFDDQGFSEYFPTDKVFILDFSIGKTFPIIQRFQNAGCIIYNVENNKEDYLNALSNTLGEFKNNWFMIYWTIIIVAIFTIIGLLTQTKKII